MSSRVCNVVIVVEEGAADTLCDFARTLATDIALPIAQDDTVADLILHVRSDGLAIGPPGSRTTVSVDFLGGASGYRRVSAGGKRQPLPRALGIHKGIKSVLDATAGLGRDAFQLASIGCSVTAIERCAVLASMLHHARERALYRGNTEVRDILARLNFVHADASTFLQNLDNSQRPDAIYLDPMFPPKTSNAIAKKEMRIVRALVGDDIDAESLLKTARRVARKRVVVKRHPHNQPLSPDHIASHAGTRVRYDVYPPITNPPPATETTRGHSLDSDP